jgi:hypothetical protein
VSYNRILTPITTPTPRLAKDVPFLDLFSTFIHGTWNTEILEGG